MSHAVLKKQIDDIAADLGAFYRKPVAEEASVLLREAISKRLGGRYVDVFLHWTEAADEDFVAAAAELKAMFSEQTGERIIGLAQFAGARVTRRPSAIWLEGKVYRIRLARMWSYSPGDGQDIRWAAEITPVGRVCAGGYRFSTSTERKKTEMDAPSEYLAEKGMRELFEKLFRVTFAG